MRGVTSPRPSDLDQRLPDQKSLDRNSWILLGLDASVLLLLGLPVAWLIGMLSGWGAATCDMHQHSHHECSAFLTAFVALLPPVGTLVGLILLVTMGAIRVRKRRSAAAWHATAWIIAVVSCVVGLSVGMGSSADNGPSKEQERKQDQEHKRFQQRTLAEAKRRPHFAKINRDIDQLHTAVLQRMNAQSDVEWEWELGKKFWTPDPNTTCGLDGRSNKRTIQLNDQQEMTIRNPDSVSDTEITGRRWKLIHDAFVHEGERLGFRAREQRNETTPGIILQKRDLQFAVSQTSPSRGGVELKTGCHFR